MATILEAVSFFEFLAAWLLVSIQYYYFPAPHYPVPLYLPGAVFHMGTLPQLGVFLVTATALYFLLGRLSRRIQSQHSATLPDKIHDQLTAMLLWIKVVLMAIFLTITVQGPNWLVPLHLHQTMRALPLCLLLLLIVFPVQILRTRRSASLQHESA